MNKNTRWRVSPTWWEMLKPLAREMRSNPTPAENRLWQRLRKQQIHGLRFRRQHAIERFIVDFYAPDVQLIIEVDGDIHERTREEDALRQEFLESLGFRVLRFTNDDIFSNLDGVVECIGTAVMSGKCSSDDD